MTENVIDHETQAQLDADKVKADAKAALEKAKLDAEKK